MNDYPRFMKDARNAIAEGSQSSGIEGYVYDGADGSQMIHWTCKSSGKSNEHVHEYDEYFVVIEGTYTLIIAGKKMPISAGQEYYIPNGVAHAGEFVAGTRTIHAFGGARAKRK
jgi:mannose-6-phosphate isomerase-like protein (cupin superfamily)